MTGALLFPLRWFWDGEMMPADFSFKKHHSYCSAEKSVWRGKGGKRKTRSEALAIIQAQDCCNLAQGVVVKGGKQSDSDCEGKANVIC